MKNIKTKHLKSVEKTKTTSLRIQLISTEHFGKNHNIGKHCMPESIGDIENAVQDALADNFEILYLYCSLIAPDIFYPFFKGNFGNDCEYDGDNQITLYFWE